MILPSSLFSIQGTMIAHAMEEAPKEACGLVVNGEYIPCINSHPSPKTNFAISSESYAAAERKGNIEAIFHSHPSDYNGFSPHDAKACRASNVPWAMYCLATGDWHYADPTGNAPYEGRQWHYGIHDCYSLVRDFYRNEFGIELDDFERGDEMEWENSDWNMFEQNFENQGFVACDVSEKKGDVVLMQLQASMPNHVGVIARPEHNIFYHHLLDRLSEANVYGGYWAKHTCRVLRHRELL